MNKNVNIIETLPNTKIKDIKRSLKNLRFNQKICKSKLKNFKNQNDKILCSHC